MTTIRYGLMDVNTKDIIAIEDEREIIERRVNKINSKRRRERVKVVKIITTVTYEEV